MTIWFPQSAKQELKSLSFQNQREVSDTISLLEDENYREQNKIDLCLVAEGYMIWSLVVGEVWLAFHRGTHTDIYIDWLSIRSRFRPL
jgi:hypothetical protein